MNSVEGWGSRYKNDNFNGSKTKFFTTIGCTYPTYVRIMYIFYFNVYNFD